MTTNYCGRLTSQLQFGVRYIIRTLILQTDKYKQPQVLFNCSKNSKKWGKRARGTSKCTLHRKRVHCKAGQRKKKLAGWCHFPPGKFSALARRLWISSIRSKCPSKRPGQFHSNRVVKKINRIGRHAQIATENLTTYFTFLVYLYAHNIQEAFLSRS